jgi:hypothetical protein
MSRLTTRILSASIAACLGLGSLAVQAQPGPPRPAAAMDMDAGHAPWRSP